MKNYQARKYHVELHNPAWAEKFGQLKLQLTQVFGDVDIYHVGSTAIPGLAAKPVIDMLVVIDDLATEVESKIQDMESIGFTYFGEYVKPGSRMFAMEKDNEREVIVHCFERTHPHVRAMLGLKGFFEIHPEIVEEYSNLKLELAAKYPNDYGEYRKHKDRWMDALKKKVGLMD